MFSWQCTLDPRCPVSGHGACLARRVNIILGKVLRLRAPLARLKRVWPHVAWQNADFFCQRVDRFSKQEDCGANEGLSPGDLV